MSEGFSYFTTFLLCVCFLIKCRHLLVLFFFVWTFGNGWIFNKQRCKSRSRQINGKPLVHLPTVLFHPMCVATSML